MLRTKFLLIATLGLVAACQSPSDESGDGPTAAFDGIAAEETVSFTGTEPFWGGAISDGAATYSTPENIDGTSFPVERFAGLNGVSFSGTMDGTSFDLTITPGDCSDGMSDRTYPYVATLMVGEEKREGCAWTESQPYSGDENP